MANYPNSMPSFPVPVSGNKLNSPNHITQHVSEDGEIVAIATELGTNPKGGAVSVKARLDANDTLVATKAAASDVSASLALKADLNGPTFTGTVSGISATMVGLGNVLNYAQVKVVDYSAKGVLLVGTGAGTFGTLGVSATDGYVLTINAASPGGMKWSAAGGGAAWGGITGTLSAQTDLQTALDAKANLAGPTFTGTVSGITATMVGLGSVTNDAQVKRSEYTAKGVLLAGTGAGVLATVGVVATNGWLLAVNSTSAQGITWIAPPTAGVWGQITGTLSNQTDLNTALGLLAPIASPTFTGTVAGVTATMVGLGSVTNNAQVKVSDFAAKGVILAGTGASTYATVPVVATNGWVLQVNSTASQGVAWAAASAGASVTRATFTNASLSAGILTITHNLGLSAPYSIIVMVFDNNAKQIIPDVVTGLTNTCTIDLTSYGTLSGTWGYAYMAA